jgi:hypothetical protein
MGKSIYTLEEPSFKKVHMQCQFKVKKKEDKNVRMIKRGERERKRTMEADKRV